MIRKTMNKRMGALVAIALALSVFLAPIAAAQNTDSNSNTGNNNPNTAGNSNANTAGNSNSNTGANSNQDGTSSTENINPGLVLSASTSTAPLTPIPRPPQQTPIPPPTPTPTPSQPIPPPIPPPTPPSTQGQTAGTNPPATTATTTTRTLTINPERPWYEGWLTDWIGWTTPPATGWKTTTTPTPTPSQPIPPPIPPPTPPSTQGQTAAQQNTQTNANTNVGPAAGAPRQEPPGSTSATTTASAPRQEPPGTAGAATQSGTQTPNAPRTEPPGTTQRSQTVSSASLPNPGSPEEIKAYLASHQPTTPGTPAGNQPPRQLSQQEALHEVEKMKSQAIADKLKEVQDGLTNQKITLEEAHKKVTDLTTFWGMTSDSKEYANALQVYRDAAKNKQIDIERNALERAEKYKDMSKAEQALFHNEAEFETAVKQLSANRDRLVQNSADPLVQVYDAVSWDKLTEKEKRYFTDDVKNPAAFLTARQSAMSKLTPDEKEYLTKRDEYISKDAALKELTAQRGKEKDPDKRKALDDQIKTAQESVKASFDTYSGLQDKALGAAYKRQAEELTTQIKSLSSEADTIEAGSKKNELERKIASLVSQQQQLDFKAREATGELTIAERLNEFVKGYTEYSGLGQFSALFIDDKDLAKRRQEAEDLFCNTIMIGGTGCWTSKICESSIDATVGGTAVVAKAASGEPRGAARIQADKSQPALFYNETTYTTTATILYRFSYFLTNINEETMRYNLVFYNADGSTLRAFVKDKELAPGQSDSRIRSSAIAKYSNKEYVKACLTFKPGIVKLTGGTTNQICSNIASYRGEATTTPNAQPTPSEQAAAGAGGTGSAGTGGTSGTKPPQDFDGF